MPSPPIEFAQEEAPVTSPPQVADATTEDANASESPSWDSRDYMGSESEVDGKTEPRLANEPCAPDKGHPGV